MGKDLYVVIAGRGDHRLIRGIFTSRRKAEWCLWWDEKFTEEGYEYWISEFDLNPHVIPPSVEVAKKKVASPVI